MRVKHDFYSKTSDGLQRRKAPAHRGLIICIKADWIGVAMPSNAYNPPG
jgi:hypothetical protein